jgi:predicted amidohydrolase YtcJ
MLRSSMMVLAGIFLPLFASEAAPPADLILTNGVIYTVDDALPSASAVAVKNHRIIAVGAASDMKGLTGPGTVTIDLGGKFVMPGFIDAHTHIVDGGAYVSEVALRDATSVAEVQQRLRDYASAHPGKGWILGEAWSYGYADMKDGAPTKEMLDQAVADRPVFLGSGMAHAAWVNSKALAWLGVTAATPDPQGGTIVRDGTGQPTGWFKESAAAQAGAKIPAAAHTDIKTSLLAAMKEASRLGITRLVSAGGDWQALPLLAKWEKAGTLSTRFSICYWNPTPPLDNKLFSEIEQGRALYHSDWVRTGAVKFVQDGVIESHTAYLPAGYADDPNQKGMNFWPADQQAALFLKLNQLGYQIYVHAIGDGAIHQTLDSYEAAQKTGVPADLRNRIEHYETPLPEDIDRLARLSVVASVQPGMIYPKDQWMGMQGMWQRLAGDKRMETAFPIHSLLAKGAPVAFGTDWPVIDLNPLPGIRDAVLRQSRDGEPAEGWVPSERITVAEAIRAYTMGAAWSVHREQHEGSITVGKLADFVVLSEDITKIHPTRIADIHPLTTIVGGKIVYQAAR